MSPLLLVLAAVTFGLMVAGIFLFIRSIGTKNPFRIPKFLLAVPVLVLVMGALSEQEKAAAPAVAPPTGEVVSFVTPPGEESSEPFVTPSPTPAQGTSERTPVQNLAIVAGRDQNDAEVAAKLHRLDAVCPEDEAKMVNVMVLMQELIQKETGQTLGIMYLLDQMLEAREEPAAAGINMKCTDTAAVLTTLLERQ